MFKRIALLVLLTIWLSLSPAFAGAGIPVKGYGYSPAFEVGVAQLVKSSPGLIYNITINATASNAVMTIYDCNTTACTQSGGNAIIYEVSSATSGNAVSVDFAAGALATANGIMVTTTNGYGFLNYQ